MCDRTNRVQAERLPHPPTTLTVRLVKRGRPPAASLFVSVLLKTSRTAIRRTSSRGQSWPKETIHWPKSPRPSSGAVPIIVGMAITFIYRCPRTGLQVQGQVATNHATDCEIYEPVTCAACAQVHLVNPKSGKVLETPPETEKTG